MYRRDIFKLLLIALVLVLCVMLVGYIDRTDHSAESELVRKAVKEAVITCYAVEGAYPDDVEYLRKYYHLSYNDDLYLVTIESFASNHLPDIYVTERGAQMQ